MRDDHQVCCRMADSPALPDRDKVPHKARVSIARSAMQFIREHGAEYPNKAAALEAFKLEMQAQHGKVSAKPGETNVVGFGILTTIFASLLVFFFERWWARTFPNQ